MKKSPVKVIELFIYALLVILAVIFAMTHGGLYEPVSLFPTTAPTVAIESGTSEEKNMDDPAMTPDALTTPNPTPDTGTYRPIYNPPPSGEFSSR